jgi:hypothetical protein
MRFVDCRASIQKGVSMKIVKGFKFALFLLLFCFGYSHAGIIAYTDKDVFSSPDLISENWQSFATNTILDGNQFDGVSYSSSSLSDLVVGSSHRGGGGF